MDIWKFPGLGMYPGCSCDLHCSGSIPGSFNPLRQAEDWTCSSAATRATEVGFLTHCATGRSLNIWPSCLFSCFVLYFTRPETYVTICCISLINLCQPFYFYSSLFSWVRFVSCKCHIFGYRILFIFISSVNLLKEWGLNFELIILIYFTPANCLILFYAIFFVCFLRCFFFFFSSCMKHIS